MISLQFDTRRPATQEDIEEFLLRAEDRGRAAGDLFVFVRMDPSESPPFILLRETLDASIYLGCIVDRAGHPKAWIEIWVQNIDRVAFSFRAQLEPLTNSILDRRWTERVAMFRNAEARRQSFETGAEFRFIRYLR